MPEKDVVLEVNDLHTYFFNRRGVTKAVDGVSFTIHPRCPFAMDRCSVDEPVLKEVGSGHLLSCHLYD